MQATWTMLDNVETALEELETVLVGGLPPGIPAHKINSLRGACMGAAQLLQQNLEMRAAAAPRSDEAWSAAPPSAPPASSSTSGRPTSGLVAGLRGDREKIRNSRLNARRQGSFSRAPPTRADVTDTTDPRDLDPVAAAAAAAAAFHAAFTAGQPAHSVPPSSPVIVRPGQRHSSGGRRPSLSGMSRTSSEEIDDAMEHIIQPSAAVRPDAAARGGFASRLKADANRGATSRLATRRQGSFSRAPVTASRDEGAELAAPDSIEERLAAAAAFHAQFVVR